MTALQRHPEWRTNTPWERRADRPHRDRRHATGPTPTRPAPGSGRHLRDRVCPRKRTGSDACGSRVWDETWNPAGRQPETPVEWGRSWIPRRSGDTGQTAHELDGLLNGTHNAAEGPPPGQERKAGEHPLVRPAGGRRDRTRDGYRIPEGWWRTWRQVTGRSDSLRGHPPE